MAVDLPIPFNRLFKGSAIDGEVFTSTATLNAYLTNPVRYAGMVAALVEGGASSLFILNATEDSWEAVGSGGGVVAPITGQDYEYVVCKGTLGGALANLGPVTFIDTDDPLDLWTTFNIFTAPSSGMYNINFGIEIGNFIAAQWNHRVDGVQGQLITSLTQRKHSFATNIWLNAGQTWELQYTGAATTTVNNGNNSYMTIAKFPDLSSASVVVDMEVGDLSNVDTDTNTPTLGDVLAYDGVKWTPTGGSGSTVAGSDKQKVINALLGSSTVTWLGDSITEDVVGYPRHVESLFPDSTFTNRAVGGHTSIDLVATQLPLAITDNADAYLIGMGLNDIRYFDGRGAVTIAAYLANMKTTTDALKLLASVPTIACMSIFPTYWEDQFTALQHEGQLTETREWNSALQAFCKTEGLLYIDMFNPIHREVNAHNFNTLYNDSVHPTSSATVPANDTGSLLYASAFFNDIAANTSDELTPTGKHFFKLVMYDHETASAGGYIGLRNIDIVATEDIGLTRNIAYSTTNLYGAYNAAANFYNSPNDFPFNLLFSTATYPSNGVNVSSLFTGAGISRGPKSFSTYYSKDPEALSDLKHPTWSLVAEELSNDGIALNVLPPSRKGYYYKFQANGTGTLNMKKIGVPSVPIRVNLQNITAASEKRFIELFKGTLTNSADGLSGNQPQYSIQFEAPYELTEIDIEAFSGLTDFTISRSFDGAALNDYVHPTWEDLVSGTSDGVIQLSTASQDTGGGNTGVQSGGVLTIGSPTSTYSISDGEGLVIDSHTDSVHPAITNVTWSGLTNLAVANLTGFVTHIAIDSGGNVVESAIPFSRADRRDLIVLGTLVHLAHTDVEFISQAQQVSFGGLHTSMDLGAAIGVINVSGNKYEAAGTDLTIKKSSGVTFDIGSNYQNNKKDPHSLPHPLLDPLTFNYNYQDGSGGFTIVQGATAIDAAHYDDGSGTLNEFDDKKWTVQRVYYLPSSELTVIQYGQAFYNKLNDAVSGIPSELFNLNPALQGALLRGFIITKGSCTDLSDPALARFIEADKFGSASVGAVGETSEEDKNYHVRQLETFTVSDPVGFFTVDPNLTISSEVANPVDGIRSAKLTQFGANITDKIVTIDYLFTDDIYKNRSLTYAFDFNSNAVVGSYRVKFIVWNGTVDREVLDTTINATGIGTCDHNFPILVTDLSVRAEIYPELPNNANVLLLDNFRIDLAMKNTTHQGTRAEIDAMDKIIGDFYYATDEGEYYGWDGVSLLLLSSTGSVVDYIIAKPIEVAPVGGATVAVPPALSSSAFDAFPSTLAHSGSTWEISDDVGFTNIVLSNPADAINLTSYTAPDGVSEVVNVTLSSPMDLGFYDLDFGGETANIIATDTITEIETKLNALTFIDTVTVSGDAMISYNITWIGNQAKKTLPFHIVLGTNTAVEAVSQERQRVTLGNFPNSGSYQIEFDGQTTAVIDYDDILSDIQFKIFSLINIGGVGGTVSLTGTPNDYVVEFGGTLNGDNVPDFTFPTNSLSLNVPELQSVVLDVNPNVGTYTLDYAGQLATILHNDGIAEIESKLTALTTVGAAGIVVTVTGTSINYLIELDGADPETNKVQIIFTNVDANYNVNEVQNISVSSSASSGSYVVTYNGGSSSAINYNDSLATIGTKINAIAQMVTDGGVVLAGSATSYSLTYNNFGDFPQVGVTSNSLNNTTSTVLNVNGIDNNTFSNIPGTYAQGAGFVINSSAPSGYASIYQSSQSTSNIAYKLTPDLTTGSVTFRMSSGGQGNGINTQSWTARRYNSVNQLTNPITSGSYAKTDYLNFTSWNSNSGSLVTIPVSGFMRGFLVSVNPTSGSNASSARHIIGDLRHVTGGAVSVTPSTSITGSSTVLTGTASTIVEGSSTATGLTLTNLSNGTQVPIVVTSIISITGVTNGNLSSGTYHWRVKYFGDNGGESSYSDGGEFIIV